MASERITYERVKAAMRHGFTRVMRRKVAPAPGWRAVAVFAWKAPGKWRGESVGTEKALAVIDEPGWPVEHVGECLDTDGVIVSLLAFEDGYVFGLNEAVFALFEGLTLTASSELDRIHLFGFDANGVKVAMASERLVWQ